MSLLSIHFTIFKYPDYSMLCQPKLTGFTTGGNYIMNRYFQILKQKITTSRLGYLKPHLARWFARFFI